MTRKTQTKTTRERADAARLRITLERRAREAAPSSDLLPPVDYAKTEYDRELTLRLRNVGRNGQLPPRS